MRVAGFNVSLCCAPVTLSIADTANTRAASNAQRYIKRYVTSDAFQIVIALAGFQLRFIRRSSRFLSRTAVVAGTRAADCETRPADTLESDDRGDGSSRRASERRRHGRLINAACLF